MSETQPTDWPAPLTTRITQLFGIRYPIIQAGMVWTAGNKLAVAVSEAGGLGLIGSGSMKPELLREHIRKAKTKTSKPFGVNIPLVRSDADELVRVTIEEGIRIVFTSSGAPVKFADVLKRAGCIVVHVIASVKHALKAVSVGCDAVVAEGFEAGGHNGIDEITTLALVPQIADAVTIPVLAAGGIADGRGMAAALALGADGVQIGTRFAVTFESSSHENYKKAVIDADDGGTVLTLKKVTPVRLVKTPFAFRAVEAERRGDSKEQLQQLLGHKREMMGIFEGNVEEGEIEAGQSSGLIKEILPAGEVVRKTMEEYYSVKPRTP
ncbi:MAG: nitronate monooxygenase [Ignavibacteria bacterium]|nr:nitronate monooxygenase [Ignavibacteria bacterium]